MSTFNKYRLKGAYHYDWYENESWYRKLIDRAVDFCQGWTIDVGGGDGLLASKILEKSHTCVVVDKDFDAAKLLLNQNIPYEYADLDEPLAKQDFDFDSVDYMACLNTIEHLNRPEIIREMIDKYATKGAIISTIEYQGGSLGEDHKKEYTMAELMKFFKKYDPKPFRIEDIWIGVEIKL